MGLCFDNCLSDKMMFTCSSILIIISCSADQRSPWLIGLTWAWHIITISLFPYDWAKPFLIKNMCRVTCESHIHKHTQIWVVWRVSCNIKLLWNTFQTLWKHPWKYLKDINKIQWQYMLRIELNKKKRLTFPFFMKLLSGKCWPSNCAKKI